MRSFLSALTFLLISNVASAVTIDFESATPGDPAPVTIDGFTFVNGEIANVAGDNKFFSTGSAYCNPFQCGPLIVGLTREDGGAFAFYGADVMTDSSSGFEMADILGITTEGGFAAGPIGTGDWLNLKQVRFDIVSACSGVECGPSGQIDFDTLELYVDNVVVQAVPIPAAFWLFGSALAGLGWLRRKQTA